MTLRRLALLLPILSACSDYEIQKHDDPVEEPDPVEPVARQPCIVVTPTSIDYGEFILYTDIAFSETVTIMNQCGEDTADTGEREVEDLIIDEIYLEDEDQPFYLSVLDTDTLAHGESTELVITYEPTAQDDYGTTIWIESNDPNDPKEAVEIEGTVMAWSSETYTFDVEYDNADIAFIIDTTCSMGSLAQQMGRNFNDIANDVASAVPNVNFGVAVYQDYQYGSFGSTGDVPFEMVQQLTDDISSVNTKLNSIAIAGGGDTPESTMEALYQAATGEGYDMNCNGRLDGTDVAPFVADSADAFGGSATGTYDSSVSGTGDMGGMGFQEGILPIIVYATDVPLRDPDNGYASPGGCNQDAGMSDVVSALTGMDAVLIGVGVNMTTTSSGYTQMKSLAAAVGSYSDIDGDGSTEEAVFTWSSYSGSTTFKSDMVSAIQSFVEDQEFETVWLEATDDPYGLVQSISPSEYSDVGSGETLDFDVDFLGTVTTSGGSGIQEVELTLYGIKSGATTGRVLQSETVYIIY